MVVYNCASLCIRNLISENLNSREYYLWSFKLFILLIDFCVMSCTAGKSSNIHSFVVSRKVFLTATKTWQGSTTAPKLHTKQAKPTVSTAYLLTEYPNINKSNAANINTQMLEGKKWGRHKIWQCALARSAVQWQHGQYGFSACPEAVQGRTFLKVE